MCIDIIIIFNMDSTQDIQDALNQECESIHKIWMNKVTEVSNNP